MKLTIEIDLDNDSFQEDSGTELASLFREIQRKFEHIHPPVGMAQPIRDTNGNTVGQFEIQEDDAREHRVNSETDDMAQAIHDTNGNTVCNCLHLKKSTCSESARATKKTA